MQSWFSIERNMGAKTIDWEGALCYSWAEFQNGLLKGWFVNAQNNVVQWESEAPLEKRGLVAESG